MERAEHSLGGEKAVGNHSHNEGGNHCGQRGGGKSGANLRGAKAEPVHPSPHGHPPRAPDKELEKKQDRDLEAGFWGHRRMCRFFRLLNALD